MNILQQMIVMNVQFSLEAFSWLEGWMTMPKRMTGSEILFFLTSSLRLILMLHFSITIHFCMNQCLKICYVARFLLCLIFKFIFWPQILSISFSVVSACPLRLFIIIFFLLLSLSLCLIFLLLFIYFFQYCITLF